MERLSHAPSVATDTKPHHSGILGNTETVTDVHLVNTELAPMAFCNGQFNLLSSESVILVLCNLPTCTFLRLNSLYLTISILCSYVVYIFEVRNILLVTTASF